jgi:hypothetical protein
MAILKGRSVIHWITRGEFHRLAHIGVELGVHAISQFIRIEARAADHIKCESASSTFPIFELPSTFWAALHAVFQVVDRKSRQCIMLEASFEKSARLRIGICFVSFDLLGLGSLDGQVFCSSLAILKQLWAADKCVDHITKLRSKNIRQHAHLGKSKVWKSSGTDGKLPSMLELAPL